MGINTQQNDYFENLFKRTTASFRAKIDKEQAANNQKNAQKSNDQEIPTTSRQSTAGIGRVLQERNHITGHDKVSHDSLQSDSVQKTQRSKGNGQNKETQSRSYIIDSSSIKAIIEQTLTQVLQEKFSKDHFNKKETSTISPNSIKSVVEETLNQIHRKKLLDLEKDTSDVGSFKSIIEDIVAQVLQQKLSNMAQTSGGSRDVEYLNRELQQKLKVSNEKSQGSESGPSVELKNTNKSLNTQELVEELLALEDPNDKNKSKKYSKSKEDKENSSGSNVTSVKRLRGLPRKKPEWKDPERQDTGWEKLGSINTQRPTRSHSPAESSTVRSGRSRNGASVLIPRSASQGLTKRPNSDPVALYQYYKNEWEHFRNQIPGETMHNRLRWHVRQRMLDPE